MSDKIYKKLKNEEHKIEHYLNAMIDNLNSISKWAMFYREVIIYPNNNDYVKYTSKIEYKIYFKEIKKLHHNIYAENKKILNFLLNMQIYLKSINYQKENFYNLIDRSIQASSKRIIFEHENKARSIMEEINELKHLFSIAQKRSSDKKRITNFTIHGLNQPITVIRHHINNIEIVNKNIISYKHSIESIMRKYNELKK